MEMLNINVRCKIPIIIGLMLLISAACASAATDYDITKYLSFVNGDTRDYLVDGAVYTNFVNGTRRILGVDTACYQYADGSQEYYTSDSSGFRAFGGGGYTEGVWNELIFGTPLVACPQNVQIGQVYNGSSYLYLNTYYFTVSSIMNIIGLEDVVSASGAIIKNAIKVEWTMDMYCAALNTTITSTNQYWFANNFGCVQQYSVTYDNLSTIQSGVTHYASTRVMSRLLSAVDGSGFIYYEYNDESAGRVSRRQKLDGSYDLLTYSGSSSTPNYIRNYSPSDQLLATEEYDSSGILVKKTMADGSVYTYYPSGKRESYTYAFIAPGDSYFHYIDENWLGQGYGRVDRIRRPAGQGDWLTTEITYHAGTAFASSVKTYSDEWTTLIATYTCYNNAFNRMESKTFAVPGADNIVYQHFIDEDWGGNSFGRVDKYSCSVADADGARSYVWRYHDAIDDYTRLLLHFDGSYADTCKTPHTVTNSGSVMGTGRFSDGALFDGVDDYVSVPASSDWDFGTGDFTLECWVNFSSTSGGQVLIAQYANDSNYTVLYRNASSGNIYFECYIGGVEVESCRTAVAPALNPGTWYHIAAVRNGDNPLIFINGVSQTLSVYKNFAGANITGIGGSMDFGCVPAWGYHFNGYMDEVRISKGVARWTGSFTPPAQPYGDINTPGGSEKFSYQNTDFTGLVATSEYDDSGKLTKKTMADGSVYTYYASGKMESYTYAFITLGDSYLHYINEDWLGQGYGRIDRTRRPAGQGDWVTNEIAYHTGTAFRSSVKTYSDEWTTLIATYTCYNNPSNRMESKTFAVPDADNTVYQHFIDEDWGGNSFGRVDKRSCSVADADGARSYAYEYYAGTSKVSKKYCYQNTDFTGLLKTYNYAMETDSRVNDLINTADIDNDGAGELCVDFGKDYGLFLYDNSGWNRVNSTSPLSIASGDIDNDGVNEFIANFEGYGLYAYDGANGWTILNKASASSYGFADLDGDGTDELIANFDGYGIYKYDDSSWSLLNGVNTTTTAKADVDNDDAQELIANFEGYGLYLYDNSAWTRINAANSSTRGESADIDGDGAEEFITNFAGYGLYLYNDSAWTVLNRENTVTTDTADIDGDGLEEIIANFSGYGLYCYNNSSWTVLNTVNTSSIGFADIDNDGSEEIVANFAGYGLYCYNNSSWTVLNSVNTTSTDFADIDGDGSDEIIANFAGYGLYLYDEDNGWTMLNRVNTATTGFADIDGDGTPEIIAEFAGYGLYAYDSDSASWTRLNSVTPSFEPQEAYVPRGDEDIRTRFDLESNIVEADPQAGYTMTGALANPPKTESLLPKL
jgi:hypothetical protein